MASVKQFPGSPNWYACYKMPTGQLRRDGKPLFRRVQRSTGTADKSRALQLAISYERAALLAAEKRWVERSAQQFLAEIQVIVGIRVGEVERTDEFLHRWLVSKQKTVAPKSLLNFSGIIGDFLEYLGERRNAALIDMTPNVLARFRDAELSAGKAPTTVNKALSVLGQAFEDAVVQCLIAKNPAHGLRVKGADRKAQKRRPFTFEEFQNLLLETKPKVAPQERQSIHPDWHTFILIAGYTGGRQQEVANLLWSNVDFSSGTIAVRRSKNGDVHTMPMHPSLLAHLAECKTAQGSGTSSFVMPHLAGLAERRLSRIFRDTILPRIGIHQPYAEKTAEKGVGRRLAALSIHSLRHSLSTWLNAAGVPEMMRMRLVGHEDENVSRNYTHTELLQAAAELAKIPSISDGGQ